MKRALIIAMMSMMLTATLSGCQESKGKEDTQVSTSMTEENTNDQNSLVGKWESTSLLNEGEEMIIDEEFKAGGMYLELDIRDDGTFTINYDESTEQGVWTAEGDSYKLSIEDDYLIATFNNGNLECKFSEEMEQEDGGMTWICKAVK